ncbi:hypothetical protein [Streptomyces sp. F001]|nr:hypothetical protein [Streptomyces sp. F001]
MAGDEAEGEVQDAGGGSAYVALLALGQVVDRDGDAGREGHQRVQ